MGKKVMKVTYLDHMSSDLGVVNAARVSFDKESDWEYSSDTETYLYRSLKDKDTKLINYLAEHHHWLPFRHPTVMFRCKAPIFVARQAVKHQVGMSWSEVSRRYVDTPPEFYTPEVWRKKADNKKQGSSEEVVDLNSTIYEEVKSENATIRYTLGYKLFEYLNDAPSVYELLLEAGVAPEQARMVLPLSTYTEWVWTGTLLAWAHFVKQRTEEHAQKEIQEFASLFVPDLERLYPVSWKALMRFYQA